MQAEGVATGLEKDHMAIAQKAAKALGAMVEGNGLRADQIRLLRHDTVVHRLPCAVIAALKAEVVKTQLRGRQPRGQVLGSHAEVAAQTEGMAQAALGDPAIQQEILQALSQASGGGFGMEPAILALHAAQKDFSVIDVCVKCNGAASLPCAQCNAIGTLPCTLCYGQGFTQCQTCFGTGHIQQGGGSQPCTRCQVTGKIQCVTCQGLRQITCTLCGGGGRSGCLECGQSGSQTHVYQCTCKAEARFELDRQAVTPEVLQIIETLGLRPLAANGHAEILRLPPEVRERHILIPFTAALPVAQAVFSVERKEYPATVAGLQARIMQIDPFLDTLVKPGISALHKLSKGPMAAQALIEMACKYKLIRQALAGVVRSSKKTVYQKVLKDYPAVLSAKYANATVQYASRALLSISAVPRLRGLVAGVFLGGLLGALYFLTPLRDAVFSALQRAGVGRHIGFADLVVWVLEATIAIYIIRFMTGLAFKKLLPESVQAAGAGLPSAGMQGFWAWPATLVVWFGTATFSSVKPEWIIPVLRTFGWDG